MQNESNWPVWATEPVNIVAPSHNWLSQGTKEIIQLKTLLNPYGVYELEHIGSTSIPGLPAKPIIDIMAKTKTFNDLEAIIEKLRPSDWHFVSPALDQHEWRRFFVRVKNNRRVCHLHLVLEDEPRWKKRLHFRDKLRKHPHLVNQYAELKIELARQYRNDRETYTKLKSAFISSVLNENTKEDNI